MGNSGQGLYDEKYDVGVQAIGEPFGEGEVENSAPFMAILFKDQPKGDGSEKFGKGKDSKGLTRCPISTSSRRFPSMSKGC